MHGGNDNLGAPPVVTALLVDDGLKIGRQQRSECLVGLIFEFKEVYCSSIQWSGGSGGDDRPMESCSFDFAAVKVTYTQQDEKGAAAKKPTGSWNVREQTKNF